MWGSRNGVLPLASLVILEAVDLETVARAVIEAGDGDVAGAARRTDVGACYSTVTVFARFRGWSTSNPRARAIR